MTSKKKTARHDKIQRLLLLWIKDNEIAGDVLTEAIISEKANAIFQDLKEEGGEGLTEDMIDFKASCGWFKKFWK